MIYNLTNHIYLLGDGIKSAESNGILFAPAAAEEGDTNLLDAT